MSVSYPTFDTKIPEKLLYGKVRSDVREIIQTIMQVQKR